MVPRLWVKLHTSAELKSIRIVVPTVLDELWFGHTTSVCFKKTSVSSGNEWIDVSCFGKCPAAVPCAMADEESGSNLKTWVLCGLMLSVTRYKIIVLKISFLSNEPIHKN